MKWLKQLIGKLKSIGGRKQAKDTTATAPAESVEESPDTTAAATEPDEKAEAAEEAATEKAKSAAADAAKIDADTVAATEEAAEKTEDKDEAPVADEPVAEAADEPVAEKAEPETVAAVDEPAEPAEKADEADTVAATEEAAEEPEAKPAPADPALSTLDEGAITAELKASGPYGPASAKPAADGSAPSTEFAVKAKESSKLFHTEKSPYFGRTKADVWFKTEADAEGAGFQAWDHKKRAAAKK